MPFAQILQPCRSSIRTSPALAERCEQAGLHEQLEVPAGDELADPRLGAIARVADAEAEGGLHQRRYCAPRQAGARGRNFDLVPDEGHLALPPDRCRRLPEMRRQAEVHPRPRLALRLKRPAAHLGQRRVVCGGLASQVILHAAESRVQHALTRQHERFQTACDTPVGVGERPNHHEVQVRQRRAHHDRHAVVPLAEPREQLVDEGRHMVGRRRLVQDPPRVRVAHVSRSRPPDARVSGRLVAQHHEVQAAEQVGVEPQVRVAGQAQDVAQRVTVVDDGCPCSAVRVERIRMVDGGQRVPVADVHALDAGGPADGPRNGESPQKIGLG